MRYRLREQFFWIIAFIFFLSPVLLLLIISFTGTWRPDESITFRTNSWQTLFTEPNILEATFWSAWIGLTVVLLNLMIAVPAGKAVVYYSFKGKPLVEALFLAPILLPVLLIAMGNHILMIRLGLADTWLGVMLIHLVPTLPYSIKIVTNTYRQLESKWLEQSEVLGAGPLRRFITIELPFLKPAVRSVVFLVIVISLSQYAITAIIGGGEVLTLAMVFFPFMDTADTSLMAAFSLWFAVLPLVLYAFVELCLLFVPYHGKYWRNHS